MKGMYWDTRATDLIIKSDQKDTEANIVIFKIGGANKLFMLGRKGWSTRNVWPVLNFCKCNFKCTFIFKQVQ